MNHVPSIEKVRNGVLIPPLYVLETFLRQIITLCNFLKISFPGTGINNELESHKDTVQHQFERPQENLDESPCPNYILLHFYKLLIANQTMVYSSLIKTQYNISLNVLR